MTFIPWHDKHVHAAHVTSARTRFGGPRRPSRSAMLATNQMNNAGSHMPIDTEVHWSINIALFLPMLLLLLLLLIGVAFS